jgi:hypothetical protein
MVRYSNVLNISMSCNKFFSFFNKGDCSGAIYSKNMRTSLFRVWEQKDPICLVLMNEPSTGSGVNEDRTTKRLSEILRANGFGGYKLINISEPNWFKNHMENIGRSVPVIISWGSKIANKKSTSEIRDKLYENFENNLWQFEYHTENKPNESMPTIIPRSYKSDVVKIKKYRNKFIPT